MEQMIETADAPWYLRQDTHWTPRFMDRVAHGISERLRDKKRGGPSLYRLQSLSVSSFGDLVAMLKLPADQNLYPAETVQVEQVEPIAPVNDEAEILLLGDSFTNIYSSATLAWGQHAGLGEHLAPPLKCAGGCDCDEWRRSISKARTWSGISRSRTRSTPCNRIR